MTSAAVDRGEYVRDNTRSAVAEAPRGPSAAIWIPYIWFFILSSRSVSRWLSGSSQDISSVDPDLSGSPVDRAVLTILIVIALWILSGRTRRVTEILSRNKALVCLFAYMLCSVVWSNFPEITFRRWVRSTGALLMVLVVLTEQSPFSAVRALLRRLYLLHIPLSALTIKYFRDIGVVYAWNGIEEMWVGLCVHKNNLGQVAMCSGLFSFWQILETWRIRKFTLDLLLFGLTLWVLRGSKNSHSSTAIMGCLLGILLLFVLQYARRRLHQAKRAFLTSVFAILMIAPAVTLICEGFDTTPLQVVLTATGRDMTLTGRTGLWMDLLDNASRSPIVGKGFGAFWVGEAGYSMYPLDRWSAVTPEWRPNEGHNGYIDIYVELGAFGLLLVMIVIGLALSGAVSQLEYEFSFGTLRMVILVGVLINNITESSLLNGTHSLWFLFLLSGVQLPRAEQDSEGRFEAETRDELPELPELSARFNVSADSSDEKHYGPGWGMHELVEGEQLVGVTNGDH